MCSHVHVGVHQNLVRVYVFSINGIAKPLSVSYVAKSFESLLMAQSQPFSNVVLNSQCQCSDETVHSQAAKAAITDMAVKLCDRMDSISVVVKLHAKHLLSDDTLETVRDFQEVDEAKNSCILESVKHSITVIGLQGFQDFLSVLEVFHLLHPVRSQGSYAASAVS